MDRDHPSYEIRLYNSKNEIMQVGTRFNGNINMLNNGESFYKVIAHSVNYNIGKQTVLELVKPSQLAPTHRADNNGRLLPKEEWLNKYGSCRWCCHPISFDDYDVKITKDGNIFCKQCKDCEEVQPFLN